jgi:dCMP deaminase
MMPTRKDIQYMQLCYSMAKIFSTCAKKQYGAILVDESGHVVGIGYNGGPSGFTHCIDGGCPRLAENSPNGSSYENCFAVHAEANALLHSDYSARAKKIYVNGPPCFSCAKLIANSTVNELFYVEDQNYMNWNTIQDFLTKAGITTHKVVLDASI